MELTGERIIPAPRIRVWEALNDPDVLRACIPGCETLTKEGEDSFTATVSMKVGPVKARMEGEVQLNDIDPPNGYTISGKGKGAAGFASGDARVGLTDHGNDTHLTYAVTAKIGGKLAEVGARFIDSTAQKMADQFFDAFAATVAAGAAGGPAMVAAAAPSVPAAEAGTLAGRKPVVIAIVVAAVLLALYLLRR